MGAVAARMPGLKIAPIRYPEGTKTAADAAVAIGCDVSRIVKSLVCTGPDGALLVLTAGHHRIDLDKLAAVVGTKGKVRMATPEEARQATGYTVGGTPPFGHRVAVPTWIDPSLLGYDVVYAAAGTPNSCFAITPAELLQATGAVPEEFCV